MLDPATGALDHRAEALLYAADKAEHLDKVVRPALDRGAVVITDRYVDSLLAYQGSGRDLAMSEVEQVARWATADLRPHLTVLLDVEPTSGLGRFDEQDRIEAESVHVPRASARVVPGAWRRQTPSTTSSSTRTSTARRSPAQVQRAAATVLPAGRAARQGGLVSVWDDLVGQDELIVRTARPRSWRLDEALAGEVEQRG